MPRRLGLLGDVHGEDALLERALGELEELGADLRLCTGDIADGPGDVTRCCELLAAHDVLTVRGNHDRWLLANTMRELPDATRRDSLAERTLSYLEALPATHTLSTPLGSVMLCHGLGKDDMGGVRPDDDGYALEVNDLLHQLRRDPSVAMVVNGHTHRPMVRHFEGLTIINAGTLLRHHDPGYLVADLETGRVDRHGLQAGTTRASRLGSLFP